MLPAARMLSECDRASRWLSGMRWEDSAGNEELTSPPAEAGRFFAFYAGCLEEVFCLFRELHWRCE
jgi:hypothetical protein